jgi:hypothetical protein
MARFAPWYHDGQASALVKVRRILTNSVNVDWEIGFRRTGGLSSSVGRSE